jgi:hypothetical protein
MLFFWKKVRHILWAPKKKKKVRKYVDIIKSIYLYSFEQREHNILDYQYFFWNKFNYLKSFNAQNLIQIDDILSLLHI